MLYSQNLQIQTPNNFKRARVWRAGAGSAFVTYVDVNKLHVNIIILDVDKIMLHVDIK